MPIQRYVQQLIALKKGEPSPKRLLSELRSVPAWVLLAEPGAGKTYVFQSETENSPESTCYLSVREFLYDDDENWRGKCLFLDGLDEVRVDQAEDSITTRIASKLKKYGIQRFRVSCRVASWNGDTDRDDLSKTAVGQPEVFTLCPIEEDEDHIHILTEVGLSDSITWLAQAQHAGLSHWLGNPQMLRLLAETKLPIRQLSALNKKDIYEYACDAYIEEQNKRHRDANKNTTATATPEEKRAAAGYLFTMMLLTNATDLSLDTDKGPITGIDTYASPHANAARQALGSTLFVPSMVEECVTYRHRTIAEYLSGWWLAGQITRSAGLPLGRVLSILTGFDQKPIAGLQGLYVWLAAHLENTNQERLIKADPISVAIYGDVEALSEKAQKQLFHACKQEVHANPTAFRRLLWQLAPETPLAQLRSNTLEDTILETLKSSETTDGHVAFVEGLLYALKKAPTLSGPLVTQVGRIVKQNRFTDDMRTTALQVWLKHVQSDEAKEMLNGFHSGKWEDYNSDLIGTLLWHLYPTSLTAQEVAVYLDPHRLHELRFGRYFHFWYMVFSEAVPANDVADFLDILAERIGVHTRDTDKDSEDNTQLRTLVHRWIAKSLSDTLSGERLLSWLLIGFDNNEDSHQVETSLLKEWLSTHSEHYKDLLNAICMRYETTDNPRYAILQVSGFLSGVEYPKDIGLWHFQHIDKRSNPDIARWHFDQAMQTLDDNQGNAGLTYAMVETWSQTKPVYREWLAAAGVPIDEWRVDQAKRRQAYDQAQKQKKEESYAAIVPHVHTLKTGEGPLPILHNLAGLWLGWFSDVSGDTPEKRYENRFGHYSDIYEAAKQGFEACLHRGDLPSVKDIVTLYCDNKHHWRMWPCLAGIALYWEKHSTPTGYKTLSIDTKSALIAFRIMSPLLGPDPDWFIALKEHSPDITAKVFLAYLRQCLKSKKNEHHIAIPYIRDALQRPQNRAIALLVLPKAIATFPTRATGAQLETFTVLLKMAWCYTPDLCETIIAKRLAHKSLDPTQRLYLFITGMLCDPEIYEKKLWDFVDNSAKKTEQLSDFLHYLPQKTGAEQSSVSVIPAHTLGKLIERQTPHARWDWPSGVFEMSQDIALGDILRGYLYTLENNTSPAAARIETQRLLAQPQLTAIKPYLEKILDRLTNRQREASFVYPDVKALASLLKNEAPASSRDLCALVLAHLDEIQYAIQHSENNLYKPFWNLNSNPKTHNDEPSCRDVLAERLQNCVQRQSITIEIEAAAAGGTRCDIRLSSGRYRLPIEIKGEWNKALWTSMETQLIPYIQNSSTHLESGYGIYLVLWGGGDLQRAAKDGGRKPASSKELKERLEKIIPIAYRERIKVVVLDVSNPRYS